jgi:hypothetical protein
VVDQHPAPGTRASFGSVVTFDLLCTEK